jgi:RPA family protein
MPEVRRQTAYKCSVKQILENNYVQRPGWDPNFIQLGELQVSRVNLMAVVVAREGNSLTIDDGTGQVQAVFFGEQNKFLDINVGDVVTIIGRPREYQQRRFVAPEIIRKVEDPRWVEYRKKELELQQPAVPGREKKEGESEAAGEEIPGWKEKLVKLEGETVENNYASIILSAIRRLDGGDGAPAQDVIRESKLGKAERYIRDLLNEGEIYELRPGKLKVLD